MAVLDDVRRLSQLDFMFLGQQFANSQLNTQQTTWHKGRLQQANDGNWIFRSISSDGTVIGVQLGPVTGNWSSSESIGTGIQVLDTVSSGGLGGTLTITFLLAQSLPQELT
jgi:hypothetical protein